MIVYQVFPKSDLVGKCPGKAQTWGWITLKFHNNDTPHLQLDKKKNSIQTSDKVSEINLNQFQGKEIVRFCNMRAVEE